VDLKRYFDNKKSKLKKKTHRKRFPMQGIKTEKERENVSSSTKRPSK